MEPRTRNFQRKQQQTAQGRCSTTETGKRDVPANGAAPVRQEGETRSGEHWIAGHIDTPAGKIPRVKTTVQFRDHLGSWNARWDIERAGYAVIPGLYAVENPDSTSPVFVSANYKMSFDVLRSHFTGMSAWILVLDTRGINVWCAAGKGTFGTDEIVNRIEQTHLSEVVSHRTVIVPQLGAPGVSAHKVKQQSGYRVVYGPVRAADIPQFMDGNLKATPEMRQVRFGFRDRLVLSPIEIVSWGRRMFWGKHGLVMMLSLGLVSGLDRSGFMLNKALHFGSAALTMYAAAFLCGAFLTPVLPWLPGRAFSIKGAFLGLLVALGLAWYRWDGSAGLGLSANILAWLFLLPAILSFIAVTFVGASTYTSLSGVFKEMTLAVPGYIIATLVGIVLLVLGQFL